MTTERTTPAHIDLKWSLTLRVAAVAIFCFLIAAGLALSSTYRDVRLANEAIADVFVRQLQMQLFRIESGIDLPARFPDWDPVADVVQSAGQCVQYVKSDGSIGRSSCIGFNREAAGPPAWFSELSTSLLGNRADVVRRISYHDKSPGTVVVTIEPAAVAAAIWRNVSGLLALTALLVVAICVLQYVAISRALRPTKDILAGLDRLVRGDLSARLPSFGQIELQRISEVFNTLAGNLNRTTREKMELAAKLVDSQEQERLHLARELHDELAQSLSAMSAVAASIKATAERECSALVPEADNLLKTSMAMMKSLRGTLHTLRPPEIDDFGLAESLSALASDQERRSGGDLKISLEVGGDLKTLPPAAASHVYRIVQEGLTNIGKHAHASRARVALDLQDAGPAQRRPSLALTIEDDGRGAAKSGALINGEAATAGGLGLIGMRERVMALGGHLDVISQKDLGFRLEATIPFEPQVSAAP